MFNEFETAQIKELIIQYGVYNNFAHFPSNDFEITDTPPLETILAVAEARGIEVLVGLNFFDDDYFSVSIDRVIWQIASCKSCAA